MTPAQRRNGAPWIGYARVSALGKRDPAKFITVDVQREAITAKAESMGVEIGEWITDLNRSGHDIQRRVDFRRAVKRVADGEAGGIVVYRLDRFSRNVVDALTILTQIDYALAACEFILDTSTPDGRGMLRIMLSQAQTEWERLAEGFVRAKVRAVEKGYYVARAPLGYLKGEDKHLAPDPETAPHVVEAFRMRAAGKGPSAIADYLAGAGVHTSQQGRTFSKQAVHALLSCDAYLGISRWTHRAPWVYDDEGRKVGGGQVLEEYVNPAAHPPLMDRALWSAAQHAAPPRVQPSRPLREGETKLREYLLTGIVRCAGCGHAMQGTTNGRETRMYRCTKRHAGGSCPAPVGILADTLEELVRAAYDEQMPGPGDEIETTVPGVDLAPLEQALELAEREFAAITPAMISALGERGLEVVTEARAARDAAASALGKAQAEAAQPAPAVALELPADVAQARLLLAEWYDAIAVRRVDGGLAVQLWARGEVARAGVLLPRRGYKTAPELTAFPSEVEAIELGVDVRAA